MNLPALCIRRPVMTTSVTVAIVLVGVVGYLFLPVAALPKVDYPTISVSIAMPGANPTTMAASIATPLEREFAAIAGVDSITSVSGLGVGRITVQFNLNRNIDAAAQDIQAAIANASRKLPAEMTMPRGEHGSKGSVKKYALSETERATLYSTAGNSIYSAYSGAALLAACSTARRYFFSGGRTRCSPRNCD